MAAELRVELLGPVRAWSGGREIALGSARPRAVFAMLATRQNSVVSREELIDGVWGAGAPATAAGSLHTYISTLRKSLEPERIRGVAPRVLTSAGSGYRLRVDREWVDATEFARLRTRAEQLLTAGDAHGALRVLDEALALWQGEALSGVSGPFADAERVRLGELRAVTMELRAEAGLAAGRHAELVAELATLVHEQPLRERPRELLMLALHRSGRTAESLAAYREARQAFVDELGIEPSPSLRGLHDQILAGDRTHAPVQPARPVATRTAPALVGRAAELGSVRTLVDELAAGRGRCLWVEGEMGIGKSALVAAALARAERAGCQVAHAAADELGQRFPLRLVLDGLDVDVESPDPRRAAVAAALHDRPGQPIIANGDPVVGAVDQLVALVKALCADGPLVLALDDLHWADEASMLVWHRLAAETTRRPLLLVGASRPVFHRAELDRLRGDAAVHGVTVDLGPLTEVDVASLVDDLVGAPPGPHLREVTARAGGNPLYVHEIADALLRDRAVAVGAGEAEVAREWLDRAPVSLVSAVTGRLGFLSATTREVLRSAALLGGEFTVGDLSVVLARPASDLVRSLDEAITAGVLRGAGARLVFRHPVLRHALYEGTAVAIRDALHHQAARALAEAGAPVEQVAKQLLLAADGDAGMWVAAWLEAAVPVLMYRAPLVAVDLLARVVRSEGCETVVRTTFRAHLASVLFRIGRDAEAERHARLALPSLTDPGLIAEIRWVLAYVPYRASRAEEALDALDAALGDPLVPDVWRARLLSLLALVQRAGVGELEVAAETARRAIDAGERAGDRFAVGQALEIQWQVAAVRRDYAAAVGYLDKALAVVGTDLSLTDLRLVLLDNRMFTLQCLDRLDEATADLDLALEIAGRRHPVAGLHVAGAVHYFWLGRWDDALAEIDAVLGDPEFTGFGLREGGGPQLLMHGVAALIATHRDDAETLSRHLAAGTNLPLVTAADRENCDFLLAAQAMAEYRAGNLAEAIATLGTILVTKHALMMLRHQWLPDLVRLALDRGDTVTAEAAVVACELEAAQETTPARAAAAARRCRCLLDGDPDGLDAVIDHYSSAGRTYELAQTIEDQAVLLRRAGRPAAAVLAMAVALYREMGAAWDIRRAEERLRG